MLTFIPLHRIFCCLFFVVLICLTVRKTLLYIYKRKEGEIVNSQLYSLIVYFLILISAYYFSGHYQIDTWTEDDYFNEEFKSPNQFVLNIISKLDSIKSIQEKEFMKVYYERQKSKKQERECQSFKNGELMMIAFDKRDSILINDLIESRKFPNFSICKDSSLVLRFRQIRSPNNLVLGEDHYHTQNKVFYRGDYEKISRSIRDSERIFVDTILYEDWRYIKIGGSRYNR